MTAANDTPTQQAKMRWKRTLFLFHRWAGIVLCLFFALWFVSGLFMMYVEFPQLTKPERIAGAPRLDFSSATLSPAAAIERLAPSDFATRASPTAIETIDVDSFLQTVEASSVRLTMIWERPAYIVDAGNDSQPRVVFADTGEVLRMMTSSHGRDVAAAFARRSGWAGEASEISFAGAVQTDQWSVSSGLNAHRPLLKYALNDAQGTVLYVSSRTGEVVRDTHARERVLNYFGAVTHWLYPTVVRKYPLVWEWIVDIVSGAGVLLAISGLWIGLMRWKRNPKPGKPAVPYRGLMRWHYFTGLSFGIVTITWVLSGLLSMNPLNLNPSRRPTARQELLFTGKPLAPADFELPAGGFGEGAVDAELMHYRGQAYYQVTNRDLTTTLVAGNASATEMPSIDALRVRARELLPTARAAEATVLTAYDDYYYSRHPERAERTLPILRVRFDDPQHTWFHLDPRTGRIIERSTRTNRVYRWIYNGLHSWDIWWLYQRRPLWDVCVIAFSVGGLVLSIIGIVIGWRRVRFKPSRSAVPGRTRGSALVTHI
jgi:uncharacterized iron-regulated membrane protein